MTDSYKRGWKRLTLSVASVLAVLGVYAMGVEIGVWQTIVIVVLGLVLAFAFATYDEAAAGRGRARRNGGQA